MTAQPADLPADPSRRRFNAFFAGLGLAATALPDTLWALAGDEPITAEVLEEAEKVAGLDFTEDERRLMLKGLAELREDYAVLRDVPLGNGVAPALRFDPHPAGLPSRAAGGRDDRGVRRVPRTPRAVPGDLEELAFAPVWELGELLRRRHVRSLDLTRMYLARLKRYDEILHCVITLTEELAEEQARRADRELDEGIYRGPLHGIPWGAKDLLARRGYPTTWGAVPFQEQVLDHDATVVRRLEDAGAVLVAKLSVGALAWGDVWFGAQTRNPWDLDEGASGSSAGSAAAVAAGLVGFAIGTETWGSIISPCTRCGATGLRPTFGRVSRHGIMALAWSMDKVGPIARCVEDCALVFDAIRGRDGLDLSVVDAAFSWAPHADVRGLRVGYLPALFDAPLELSEDADEAQRRAAEEWRQLDRECLDQIRSLGVELVPLELPELPVSALSFILSAEAAAGFDELTRGGRDDLMVRQIEQAWPNVFRQARLIPAVEYIQANRVRTVAMRELERITAGIDAWVSPTFGGDHLLLTNLTGHPAVVVRSGFRSDGTPTSLTFTGALHGESELLTLAHAFEAANASAPRKPPGFQDSRRRGEAGGEREPPRSANQTPL